MGFLESFANQYKSDALSGSQSGMNQHTVDITNDSTPYLNQIHISDSWVNDAGHNQGLGVEIQQYKNKTEATSTYNTLTEGSQSDGAQYGIWWGLNEYASLVGHQPTVKHMLVTHQEDSNQYGL
ncbi:MAG TPA: hypothetical protein VEB88_01730 [Candidatus Acidoferrales bacterium]|nr:hypothetical protein [Candidatus Acidoferrales bacterium]